MLLEEKVTAKLKEIREQDIKIKELQDKRKSDFEELNKAAEVFGLHLVLCGDCGGAGEVSYTSGYQDCNNEYKDCGTCKGAGLVLVEV